MERFQYDEKHKFLHKLEELVQSGTDPKKINTFTPYPVHEAEEILKVKTSPLRFFTLIGALSGLLFGFFITIWMSMDWPIIRGGKPIVAFPAFVIVAFELTVLFNVLLNSPKIGGFININLIEMFFSISFSLKS